MQPLAPARVPQSEIEGMFTAMCQQWKNGEPEMRKLCGDSWPEAKKAIRQMLRMANECLQFRNDVYQVAVRKNGENSLHLSIKRNDRQPIHDWRDLQEIKNQICGPETEAVELYPAESRGSWQSAWASFVSDMRKHPETKNHIAIDLGTQLVVAEINSNVPEMRKFIEGFN